MSELKKSIEDWLKDQGLEDKYRIRTKEDAFMGEMLVLFSVYNNGVEHFEIETNYVELIKDHIKEREHI